MKKKMAAAMLLATLFVSVPLVFKMVYRHVLPQLAGRESDTMINSVAVVYTVLLYVPVLAVVALLLWVLLRSQRRSTPSPYAWERYSGGGPSSDATPADRPGTIAGFVDGYLLAEHPEMYIAMGRGKDRTGKRHDRKG